MVQLTPAAGGENVSGKIFVKKALLNLNKVLYYSRVSFKTDVKDKH